MLRKKFLLVIIALAMLAGLFAVLGNYARQNPGSFLALEFYRCGILCFEPSFTERRKGGQLLDGFQSYQSCQEVTIYLQSNNFSAFWDLLPTNNNPSQGISSLIVTSYVDIAQTGSLRLNFFNDRLESAVFFPADSTNYFKALKSERGVSFPRDGKLKLSEVIMIERGLSYPKRVPCVSWIDERLKDESVQWMVRH